MIATSLTCSSCRTRSPTRSPVQSSRKSSNSSASASPSGRRRVKTPTNSTSTAMIGWAENPDALFEGAYVLAQKAVTLDPRYPNAHFALGLACMWTRRSERGIAAFEEAVKLNPSFAAAHVLLGQMYLFRGQPEEALALAEKGIRLNPRDPRLFIWLPALAGANYELLRYEEAVEIGSRAWAFNRSWRAGLRYVVAGLGQLGRVKEAQRALVELKAHEPSLAYIERRLTRFYRNREVLDHFLAGLRKAG